MHHYTEDRMERTIFRLQDVATDSTFFDSLLLLAVGKYKVLSIGSSAKCTHSSTVQKQLSGNLNNSTMGHKIKSRVMMV
jgi:hypothetical protein